MIGIKERSLIDALSYCFLTELPKEENKREIWIRAIAEVEKRDGTHSYVYVEKDTDTLENIVKVDFGHTVQTTSVIAYYPFCYLDAAYVPEFKSKKKEDKVNYLKVMFPEREFESMKEKELDQEILKIAIQKQLNVEKASDYAKRNEDRAEE